MNFFKKKMWKKIILSAFSLIVIFTIYVFATQDMLISNDTTSHKHKGYGGYGIPKGDSWHFPRGVINPLRKEKYDSAIKEYIARNFDTLQRKNDRLNTQNISNFEIYSIKKYKDEKLFFVRFFTVMDGDFLVFRMNRKGEMIGFY